MKIAEIERECRGRVDPIVLKYMLKMQDQLNAFRQDIEALASLNNTLVDTVQQLAANNAALMDAHKKMQSRIGRHNDGLVESVVPDGDV